MHALEMRSRELVERTGRHPAGLIAVRRVSVRWIRSKTVPSLTGETLRLCGIMHGRNGSTYGNCRRLGILESDRWWRASALLSQTTLAPAIGRVVGTLAKEGKT